MTDPVSVNELIRALHQDAEDLDSDISIERVKPVDIEVLIAEGHGETCVRQFKNVDDVQTTRKWIKLIWFNKRTVEIKKKSVLLIDIRLSD